MNLKQLGVFLATVLLVAGCGGSSDVTVDLSTPAGTVKALLIGLERDNDGSVNAAMSASASAITEEFLSRKRRLSQELRGSDLADYEYPTEIDGDTAVVSLNVGEVDKSIRVASFTLAKEGADWKITGKTDL